ncbi:MAG: four helix bundle protein [Patescibacteria group bacterium]|nr:four helix bundle protein [Patescibacteria group bacterium]
MQNCNSKFKNDLKLRAYKFSLNIIKLINGTSSSGVCKIINHQLLRSATSIGANIIEAQAASSKNDFKNFMNHSLKSANETKYWLCLVRDSKMIKLELVDPLLREAIELSKILGASMLRLKGRK